MWKDYFYFSGAQRVGILVLLCLILLVGLADCFLPVVFKSVPEKEDALFLAEIDAFKKSLVAIDSIKDAERSQKYSSKYNSSYRSVDTNNDQAPVLFPFDPNELDSIGFIALGLKRHVVSNILKYRRKGGFFKDSESFARVYGISEKQFLTLLPYIQISKRIDLQKDTARKKVDKVTRDVPLLVELNTADTTELMQINGVGRAYAHAILKYRKQAGGFTHIEQLGEIYGMTPDNLEKIKPHCTINRDLIQKIKVNIASVEKLKAHPYLNFYQARQIYELRRKKGALSGLDDLTKLSELNDTTLEKIAEYLSFE